MRLKHERWYSQTITQRRVDTEETERQGDRRHGAVSRYWRIAACLHSLQLFDCSTVDTPLSTVDCQLACTRIGKNFCCDRVKNKCRVMDELFCSVAPVLHCVQCVECVVLMLRWWDAAMVRCCEAVCKKQNNNKRNWLYCWRVLWNCIQVNCVRSERINIDTTIQAIQLTQITEAMFSLQCVPHTRNKFHFFSAQLKNSKIEN